jgi:phosphatidylinositol 3-kinase
MDRLEKLVKRVKRHEQGDLPRLDWLDNLAFRKIEQLHTSIKSNGQVSDDVFIYIDFPRFDFPIVFSEPEYEPASLHPSATIATKGILDIDIGGSICCVWDPEAIRNNPVEAKHRRQLRSVRNNPNDKDLKPNAKIRDELNVFFPVIHG